MTAIAQAIANFADEVRRSLGAAALADAQAEEQLKAPSITLFAQLGDVLGVDVSARPEARLSELGVRPDLGVLVRGLVSGHVELKAPGKGARPERLRDPRDKEQWNRLKAHPNLIYTDGTEWGLYRSGERVLVIRASGDVPADGRQAFSGRDIEQLDALLRDFLGWRPIVPSTSKALAEMLAPLCGIIRGDVLDALAYPDSHLAVLAQDWRQVLFPDADDAQFADAYAQTLTYALLLARFSGQTDLQVPLAAASLRRGHALLSRALNALGDPDVTDEIGLGVDLLQRVISEVDPDRLRRGSSDPWLYFYEHFLAAYDPKLRKDRGVYYTPVEVVEAQVHLVSNLLSARLGKPLGFADTDVVFLDPAVGTGTYVLAAIENSLEMVRGQYGEGSVPARASVIARNMHAFEVLVGPYSVAHLRITQGLLAAGAQLPDDGVHVYLTDTLESPYARPEEWHVAFNVQLSEEHRKAMVVKRDSPVLVCLGNPPYDRQTISEEESTHVRRKGGWVRFGDGENRTLLQDFIEPLSADDRVHAKNLYNDYVYFWRWALWKTFESSDPQRAGVVSFITAGSYLRGPWAKGMREHIRRTCDEVWIIDLEGGNLGPRKTENVFAIQNPVAIAVCARYGESRPDVPAVLHYTRIQGTRDEKLAVLAAITNFDDVSWEPGLAGWQDPFGPVNEGDFFGLPLITDLFPWQHAGVQTKRPWVIAETPELLEERWRTLLSVAREDRAVYFRETRDRKVTRQYPQFHSDETTSGPPIVELADSAEPPPPVRYAYRVLDRRWLAADGRLVDFARPPLWAARGSHQTYITTLTNTPLGEGPAVFAAADVPDMHHFRGSYGGKDVIPLWRDAAAQIPNIGDSAWHVVSSHLGITSPEDLFAYTYAVLSAPSYALRFSEDLLYSAPRVPITKDPSLYERGAEYGRKLLHLHTFGERFGRLRGGTQDVQRGLARCTVPVPESPSEYPDEDPNYDAQRQSITFAGGEFSPVAPGVWEYSVSGYRVVESWLKSRTRSGTGRSSSPLDEMRPQRWIASMTEDFLRLLWILEATIAMRDDLDNLLEDVLASECFGESEMPEPSEDERRAPSGAEAAQQQLEF